MTDITTNLPEKVATAIKRAYALGQLYWQQADSDSYKQNAKSDETRAKFDELLFQASANVQGSADEIDRLRAEVARLTEANRYLIGISNEAMEDARKYAEAQREVSRLRHEVAQLCGYDSVEEMDAAVGRRK